MKSKIGMIILSLFALGLSSCGENSSLGSSSETSIESSYSEETSTSVSSEKTSSSETISSSDEESSSSQAATYQKDEEGFYILEDDYFSFPKEFTEGKESKARFYDELGSSYKYEQMRLFLGDKQIPIMNCKVNISQTWNGDAPSRVNSGVAFMQLEGIAELKIQCNFLVNGEVAISPKALNVNYSCDEARRVVSLKITQSGQYIIELRDGRTLNLFVDDYDAYKEFQEANNVIYFGPGIHNHQNSSYIDSNNMINLNSNDVVFLDQGAIVQAGFTAYRKDNITIAGYGVVDGSVFDRSATTGTRLIPYEFSNCSNVKIYGITTTDPAGWCYNMFFCNQVVMDNVKIISSRSNGDGISIQSCQNVKVTNSFVRSWDDSLVVKNYPSWDKSTQGTTKNIEFSNCLLWTDLAQSMEVGYETVGKVMEDIRFDNITVIHNYHKAIISIHNANNADIKQVKFTNITIQDARMGKGDGNKYLVDFSCLFNSTWSTNHMITELGSIDGVLVKNVLVEDSIKDPVISTVGSVDTRSGYNNSVHKVSNVTFSDFKLQGSIIDSSYSNLKKEYAENIIFEKTGVEVTGADIIRKDSSMYSDKIIIG